VRARARFCIVATAEPSRGLPLLPAAGPEEKSRQARTGRAVRGVELEHARNGSLGAMFDHVGIAVSDLAASERFYRTVLSVLGVEPSHADAGLVEWEDWAIGPMDREHPVTRGLHVGFRAPDRAAVDAFWQAGIDAGHPDDGAPGPRTVYGPDYYGGFLLDPDGNSVEAVHGDRERPVPDGRIDHLWLRVRDLQASRRFYTTVAPYAGLRLAHDAPDRVQLSGPDFSFSLVRDERPLTEHVHLAFPADADATVRAFHAAACTTRATTAPSCSTRMATTSRSSTTTAEPWPASPPPPHLGRGPGGARGRAARAREEGSRAIAERSRIEHQQFPAYRQDF
jgi:catechol 2,3-dioxygenase-like lactoylglutathione lyase family enzyme